MRLMNSGISGLQAEQTALDVISNNIANQGTTSFKGSNTRFEDMLSQTQKNANVATVAQGGTNASQVGLGVKVAGITIDTTQGNMETTGRKLDAAIDGDGYFIVGKGTTVFNDNAIKVESSIRSTQCRFIFSFNFWYFTFLFKRWSFFIR